MDIVFGIVVRDNRTDEIIHHGNSVYRKRERAESIAQDMNYDFKNSGLNRTAMIKEFMVF